MALSRSIRRYGAIRSVTVFAIGMVVVFGLGSALDLDYSRGSWHRYAAFVPAALISVAVLELWRRARGEDDSE